MQSLNLRTRTDVALSLLGIFPIKIDIDFRKLTLFGHFCRLNSNIWVKTVILMGKRELIALLNLSSWCLVMVERLFLAVPGGSLQFVIVVFPDHTQLLFLNRLTSYIAKCNHCTRCCKIARKIPAN